MGNPSADCLNSVDWMLEFNSVVYTWFRICISHSLSCLWCLNSSIFAWDFMGGWAHQCNKGFLLLLRGPQSVLSLEIDQWIEVLPAFSILTLAVYINSATVCCLSLRLVTCSLSHEVSGCSSHGDSFPPSKDGDTM